MGKCKSCKCGDMIYGQDKIKESGKEYQVYICTNCDSIDYLASNSKNKKNNK